MMERTQEKRTYEFAYLLSGTLTKEAAERLRLDVEDFLKNQGAQIIENDARGRMVTTTPSEPEKSTGEVTPAASPEGEDSERSEPAAPIETTSGLKLRQLAYPIDRQTTAYAGKVVFASTPELPEKVRERFQHEKSLLRSAIVKNDRRMPRERKPRPPRPEARGAFGRTDEPAMTVPPRHAPVPGEMPAQTPEPSEQPPAINVAELDKKLQEIIG
ncbi:MAG: 30S ribosomal protein S6 [bacterium]|nr:30S ribosomal protein S6 [bacterium]MDZ4296655.1 hypothetical protein [Patescibacteria group bacterium]